MRSSVARQYLQFNGRLSRRRFNDGLRVLLILLFLWLQLPAAVVALAGIWPGAMAFVALALLAIPRLHDTGLSGFWVLAICVPVAGPAWLAWRLCARAGMRLENRYGADPAAPSPDYLVVS